MNSPIFDYLKSAAPLSTTVSSPRLDLTLLAWDHIAERYLARIASNRQYFTRVRSIRLMAVHDAIQSVVDPGNGLIFNESSAGTTTTAAAAAAVKASHDILAAVFNEASDRLDLADLLEESLDLFQGVNEKAVGTLSGTGSADAYLDSFVLLLFNDRPERRSTAA
jgi:hypothetical protein